MSPFLIFHNNTLTTCQIDLFSANTRYDIKMDFIITFKCHLKKDICTHSWNGPLAEITQITITTTKTSQDNRSITSTSSTLPQTTHKTAPLPQLTRQQQHILLLSNSKTNVTHILVENKASSASFLVDIFLSDVFAGRPSSLLYGGSCRISTETSSSPVQTHHRWKVVNVNDINMSWLAWTLFFFSHEWPLSG